VPKLNLRFGVWDLGLKELMNIEVIKNLRFKVQDKNCFKSEL
jgi:hypothetical protein